MGRIIMKFLRINLQCRTFLSPASQYKYSNYGHKRFFVARFVLTVFWARLEL